MKGSHVLTITSAHLRYDMIFSRNLTIIQGDSATGKTTLVEMIQAYLLNGSDTGISLICDCPCRVIAGNLWKEQMEVIENSIVFIDEGNRFVSSVEFAEAVRESSNYYVIITREPLNNLPYSVTEIYGIRSSGKYNSMEPVYHHMYRIYSDEAICAGAAGTIVVEDSHAGYEFFSGITGSSDIHCLSAEGADHIFALLQELKDVESLTVIADGAAFGSQIGRIFQLMQRRKGIRLYLPESFEWLILSADVLNDSDVRMILEHPSDYIDSREYFSWERFFTALLTEKSHGTWLQYSKSKLNPVYLKGKCRDSILSVLPEEIRNAVNPK